VGSRSLILCLVGCSLARGVDHLFAADILTACRHRRSRARRWLSLSRSESRSRRLSGRASMPHSPMCERMRPWLRPFGAIRSFHPVRSLVGRTSRSCRLPALRSDAPDLSPGRRGRTHRGGAILRSTRSTARAQFLASADEALSVVLQAPDRWRIIEADVRRYAMRRFPYFIYYRILPDHLRILTFAHQRRHPDYWRGRLLS
jgi:hypothetical protein